MEGVLLRCLGLKRGGGAGSGEETIQTELNGTKRNGEVYFPFFFFQPTRTEKASTTSSDSLGAIHSMSNERVRSKSGRDR